MAFRGATPFGELLAGWLGSSGSPPSCWPGTVCLIGALAFATQLPRLRQLTWPVYARLDILPRLSRQTPSSARRDS
ncbi:MAG TPA: hypothetical protein VL371_23745 [Gemmataceae bacterium]|jgi:hypothetical protein|nr:hypothetical protein [Gemmataceae bacterium]